MFLLLNFTSYIGCGSDDGSFECVSGDGVSIKVDKSCSISLNVFGFPKNTSIRSIILNSFQRSRKDDGRIVK